MLEEVKSTDDDVKIQAFVDTASNKNKANIMLFLLLSI